MNYPIHIDGFNNKNVGDDALYFETKYLNKDYTIVITSAHSKNNIIDRVVEDIYFPKKGWLR